MPFLKILNKKQGDVLPPDAFAEVLAIVLRYIEAEKGEMDLEKIYSKIGSELLKINISSLFGTYAARSQTVEYKYHYAVPELRDFVKRKMHAGIRSFPLDLYSNYQKAIAEKRPQFTSDWLGEAPDLMAAEAELAGRTKMRSVAVPLVLRGEAVGIMELLSPDLSPVHMPILENFAGNLTKTIANTILFEEMKRTEQRYKNIFEYAQDGFVIFNAESKAFVDSNQGMRELSGYTKDEMRQINYLNIFAPNAKRRVKAYIDDCIARARDGKFCADFEVEIVAKNQKTGFATLCVNKTPDPNEFFLVFNDITLRKKAQDDLRISEEKYRHLIENALDSIVTIDKKGRILYVNDACARLFGFAKEEMPKQVIFSVIHPEDRERIAASLKLALSGPEPSPLIEARVINRAGLIKYVQASVAPFRVDGRISGLQIFIRDISENKKLLEKVESAKQHYEQVIDTIQDGLCVVNRNYQIVSYNRIFAKRVNWRLNKLKGKNYREIVPRYDNDVLREFCTNLKPHDCIIDIAFATRKPAKENIAAYDRFGQKKYYKLQAYPALDKHRQAYQVVVVFSDTTDRMREEEKVRWLSEFNQRILDTAPISIVVLDKRGVVIAANGTAKKLMDSPARSIVGQTLVKTKEIAGNRQLVRLYQNILEKGDSLYYDNLAYISETDGTRKYLNIIAVPLFDKDKNVEGALSMALDNTEAVMAKQALEELNISLEKKVIARTRELDILNQKLNHALELKSKFIADASHELRTPLTVIQGNLDLAMREADIKKTKVPEALPVIMHEVQRINSILTDLTLLTNVDQHEEKLTYEKVDLTDLTVAAARSLRVLAEQKDLKMSHKNRLKNISVMGDEAKLEKLILNVLRNAIKYTDPRGKVAIWAEKDAREARVVVKDTGIGIPEKDLPFIFERFYRVDKARSRAEGGTGIGLSIAKWIAEAHNGRITVKSELGKGSEFTIHLPFDYRKIV